MRPDLQLARSCRGSCQKSKKLNPSVKKRGIASAVFVQATHKNATAARKEVRRVFGVNCGKVRDRLEHQSDSDCRRVKAHMKMTEAEQGWRRRARPGGQAMSDHQDGDRETGS